jgi:tetratricopeptide (TPR) repeat protein
MALDHWAYVADARADRQALTRLLDLARRADPDPEWGDRFREPALWGNPEALRQLVAEAQERLAQDEPANGPPTALVTLLAKKLGKEDNPAEPLLRAAQGRHPEDFWLNYALGEALRESKPAEAVGFYRAALATRPTVVEVHFRVSEALWRQGQVDEAIRASRMAIKLDPEWAHGHHMLGTCWQAKGQLDEAMAEYRRAIELDPKMAAPDHFQLGRCWQAKGQLDEAMAEYRRAIELDPNGAPAHYMLGAVQGQTFAARQDWAKAADAYARGLKRGPTDDGHFWFEYAALLLLSGDRPGYAKACAHMIAKCSKNGSPRAYHVARACTLAPDSVEEATLPARLAEKELQAARQFWSLTEQGALAYRAGRFQEAVAFFEQSLGADATPGRAVVNWVWLALANQRLGKAEEARRWLGKAQEWLDQYRDGMPARAEEELGLHFHNWLEAHVLRREAEALLSHH